MARGFRIIVVMLSGMVAGTIHEGDYELKKLYRSRKRNGVLPFTKITGTLRMHEEYSGDVGTNLPYLEEVGNIEFDQTSQVESVFLPELIKICGYFGALDNVHFREIRFPKLTSAGAFNMAVSTNLETLFLPELKKVGDIYITQTKLKQLAFPVLEQIGYECDISKNNHLEEFHIPNLKTVDGNLDVKGNGALTQINIPALEQVGADCEICKNDHLEQFHLPNLKTVGEALKVRKNDQLEELHLPNLKTIGDSHSGYLNVDYNDELTLINLSKLETVGQRINIDCNEKLELLYLPELKTLKKASGGNIVESNDLDSKLIMMPKVPVFQLEIFCNSKIEYFQEKFKMKFEGFELYQQARDASAFAIIFGINWSGNFHKSKGKGLDVSTIFPKKRRQGRRRNLLNLDKSVLRNIFLMLQPAMWHEKMVETFILVQKYKHILDPST